MLTKDDQRDIASYLGKLGRLRLENRREIPLWRFREAEYIGPGKTVMKGRERTIATGTVWQAQTAYFMATVTPDPRHRGKPVYLEFDNGAEGLLYVDGEPAAGLDPNHTLCCLGEAGKRPLELTIESACRWQSLAHARQNGREYPPQVFSRAALCTLNEAVHRVYTILGCMAQAGDPLCERWLLHARHALYPDAPREQFTAACLSLAAELEAALAAASASKSARSVLAAGHSHLDLGYLWPVKESVRKMARTFSGMLHLTDRNGDFSFSQSQAVLFEWAKQYYPALFTRVRQAVADGRWEPVGGMYVEADGNMVSAEGYIRQLLYGMDFFRQNLGTVPTVGWLPDTFGLSGILPQILKKCGLDYFYSMKLRTNRYYEFPFTLYEWEGIDGSRVTAHLSAFCTYSGDMTAGQLREGMTGRGRQDDCGPVQLYVVGYGDGGGGVTQEMIDQGRVFDSLPGLPRVRWGKAREYFEDAVRQAGKLPVWRGEHYHDQHQGTLTTQAALKKYNRQSEGALLDAEVLDVLAGGGQAGALRELWKPALLNQFHDILPGSCQKCVADEAAAAYEKLLAAAARLRRRSMKAIVSRKKPDCVTVFNTAGFARSGYVEAGGVSLYARDIPAFGYRVVQIEAMGREDQGSMATLTGEAVVLENEALRVAVSRRNGQITSLVEKTTGREALAGPSNRFVLYDEVYEFYDAWNIHHETLRHPLDPEGACRVSLTRNDGQCAIVTVDTKLSGRSELHQQIWLRRHDRRVDFITRVHWQETGRMLKVVFEPDIQASHAAYDLSYGNIMRSTGSNTDYEAAQIEVCAHTWADLSDAGFGLALLNDCKYGHRIKDGVISLTLLKSAKYPDDQADMGEHRFTYSLYPHPHDHRRGGVHEEAVGLNRPLLAFDAGHAPRRAEDSLLSLSGQGVYAQLCKAAHDGSGDLILRLYENHAGKVTARLGGRVFQDRLAYECDMLEQKQRELADQNGEIELVFTPYEIKTLRLSPRSGSPQR